MRRTIILLLLVCLAISACKQEDEGGGAGAVDSVTLAITPGVLVAAGKDLPYQHPLWWNGPHNTEPTLLWTVSSGALPPGIALSGSMGDGLLSGTPSAVGSYSFEITLSFGTFTHRQNFSLAVLANAPLQITTSILPFAVGGSPYNRNLYATGGSGTGYTWHVIVAALPPGLTLDGKHAALNWGAFSFAGNLDQSLGGGRLSEVSGMVASRSQPGVFWVHDDSGAGPEFYAIDAQGNVLQHYAVTATAVDWEDIAIGPGPGGTDCIFIGDFGDNALNRTNCCLLRIVEPTVPSTPGAPINVGHDEFWFTYPGGSQNCETLFIEPVSGTPYLVEKTAAAPRVHKFTMPLDTAWTSANPVTLTSVSATGTFDGTLTGGDVSACGRRVILRGYGSAREYGRPAGFVFDDVFAQPGTAVTVPGGQQYEAICYSADGTRLFTCTELAAQATAPIHVAQAPLDTGATTISGTPTTLGNYTFTVQVRDSAGNTAQRQFMIVVR
ncbi:MAG: putative Ig domain-containing protein [Planctomycetes bacterium]|nr:putative Ig domain-containing protein [Planctomycetota bacterium]MCW8135637.1 putative Ig domain-containing protein [Planctomycetota bacterium]